MKLIAIKDVSPTLPAGAPFTAKDEQDGNVLIATGFFRAATSDEAPPSTTSAPTPRRTYRRRDLTAENGE
jgi:hypothetical protein